MRFAVKRCRIDTAMGGKSKMLSYRVFAVVQKNQAGCPLFDREKFNRVDFVPGFHIKVTITSMFPPKHPE